MIRSERGQTTTEYVLMLAMVLSLFVMINRTVLRPSLERLSERVSAVVDRFFSRGLHTFPLRP